MRAMLISFQDLQRESGNDLSEKVDRLLLAHDAYLPSEEEFDAYVRRHPTTTDLVGLRFHDGKFELFAVANHRGWGSNEDVTKKVDQVWHGDAYDQILIVFR